MLDQRVIRGVLVMVAGFAAIAVVGKVIFPGWADTTVVPNGLYFQGLVVGLLSALLAIGLVLVYRANRIINFAQGSLGAVAATLASQLFQVYRVPYVIAVLTGLAAGVAASLLMEFLVIRRFAKAPRLILTVATIGVAQLLTIIELIPNVLNRGADRDVFRTKLKSPLDVQFEFGAVRFTDDHLIVVVAVPLILAGLVLFLRRTRYGVAARATAENADRARLLGCSVKRVGLVVWGVAGGLSALTAILRAPILGFQLGAAQGPGLLLRALAAAVIGRMESLPITVAAAVLLTMGEQTIFFSFGRVGPAEGFLLGVIVLGLLVQRERLGRVDPGSSSWRAVQEVRPVPRELATVPEVRSSQWVLRGLAVLVAAILPFVLSASNTNLASVILIYSMVGISLVVLTGWSGNVSLGHWAIVGVGGLVGAKLATLDPPLDFFLVLMAASLIGAAVSVVIGLPALRIRGLFLGVTTLAFAVVSFSWFFQFESLITNAAIRRPVLFGLWDITAERDFYFVSLAGLLFALLVARNLRRSRFGRNLIAMRDNEVHAQAFGMRLVRGKLGAFAISGFLAALAGVLFAYNQQTLRHDNFVPETSLVIFSMVVIGGMGSLAGAFLGAAYVGVIQFYLPAELQLFATGFGLLILLLVFPGGLGQVFYGMRDRLLRDVAARRDIVVPSLIADKAVADPVPVLAEAKGLPDEELKTVERQAKAKVLAQTRRRT